MMYKELIASQTLGAGGATSITFSSIPATYTELFLVVSGRTTANFGGSDIIAVQLNGDTTSGNYAYVTIRGYGGTAYADAFNGSGGLWLGSLGDSSNSSNAFGCGQMLIPNYAGSAKKDVTSSAVSLTNVAGTTFYEYVSGSRWSSTAVVNSLRIYSLNGSTLAQYTTAYLYGLTKGSGFATTTP